MRGDIYVTLSRVQARALAANTRFPLPLLLQRHHPFDRAVGKVLGIFLEADGLCIQVEVDDVVELPSSLVYPALVKDATGEWAAFTYFYFNEGS